MDDDNPTTNPTVDPTIDPFNRTQQRRRARRQRRRRSRDSPLSVSEGRPHRDSPPASHSPPVAAMIDLMGLSSTLTPLVLDGVTPSTEDDSSTIETSIINRVVGPSIGAVLPGIPLPPTLHRSVNLIRSHSERFQAHMQRSRFLHGTPWNEFFMNELKCQSESDRNQVLELYRNQLILGKVVSHVIESNWEESTLAVRILGQRELEILSWVDP